MRHRKKINHLGRKSPHRKAMLANMATSLILHKRISTTTAKAKALRMYLEPLITKSKDDSTHARRTVFSYLQSKEAVNELFREVSTKVASRPGGYTRILKVGTRLGDNADMCIIELVDYNENLLAAKSAKSTSGKTRRSRRGGAKKDTETQVQAKTEATPAKESEVVEEVKQPEVEAKPEAENKVEQENKENTEENTESSEEDKS